MSALRRADDPGPGGPKINIIRIKGPTPALFTLLSPKVWGFVVHWNGFHTTGCTGETPETCKGHKAKMPLRWKGFFYVIDHQKHESGFLEVTPDGLRQMREQIAEGASFRGYRVRGSRSSTAKGARYRLEILPVLQTPDVLVKDRDPTPDLNRLWQMD